MRCGGGLPPFENGENKGLCDKRDSVLRGILRMELRQRHQKGGAAAETFLLRLGELEIGQVSYMIKAIPTVQDVFDELLLEYREQLSRLAEM